MRLPAILGAMALAGSIAVTTGAQAPSPSPPPPAFPSGADAVTVDVVVLDKDGSPVPDLTRDDFTITEDGAAQSITAFDSIAVPPAPLRPDTVPVEVSRPAVSSNARPARPERMLVVVFDDAHLTSVRGEVARKAITQFLEAEGRAGDRVTLVPTSGGTWWTTVLPQGAADLAGVLGRLKGLRIRDSSARQIGEYEALRIFRYRDEKVRNEVFTRLMEMDQIGDTDSGSINGGALKGLDIAPGRLMVDNMAAAVFTAAEQRMKVTLDLLERVLASLGGQRGRKTVLLVSEGFLHDPQIEGFARVARRAADVNAEVDFVDARGLDSDLPTMADAEIRPAGNPIKALGILQRSRLETQGAESIAIDTGGLVLRGGNDLEGALRRAADASRAYYLLGYQPTTAARDGKFRRIEVKVGRPGLTVRARKGYFAPRAEEAVARKPDAIDPDVQRALDAPEPTADIPLRLAAYRIGPAAGGKTKVRLTAELDPGALAFVPEDGRSRDTLDTFFLVASRETGGQESHQAALDLRLPPEALARLRATWLPLQRDFELGPGVYQARLAVRDGNARRVASVVHDFEVPGPAGLGFTSPVLTDTVVAPGRAGDPPRPALLARRAFAAGARLYCQFEVTGADPSGGAGISAGHELRRVGGPVLAHLDPTPMPPAPDGRRSRLLAISLRTAQPGEHELVLTARDDAGGETVETRERFLVTTPEEAATLGAVVAVADSAAASPPAPVPMAAAPPVAPPSLPPAAKLKDVGRAAETALTEEVVPTSGPRVRRVRADRESQATAVDAALLITEAALLRPGDEADGLDAARRLFEALGDSAEARDRQKRWALAVSGHFVDQSRLPLARRWAEEARRLDASDPAVLVALGLVGELQATLGEGHGTLRPVGTRGLDPTPAGSESLPKFQGQAERERLARGAEDLYARALERDPKLAEARLRRGRLLARRGRVTEAASDLDRVVAEAADPRLRAVAHLLLARQLDAQGEVEPALRHYVSAAELAPGSLSAMVGRSELLSRTGRAREAAQDLTSALSRRDGGDTTDPWLAYFLGFHARTADVLATLRIAGPP